MTATREPPAISLPVTLVADLQDALLMAMTDLKRLEGLLDHATDNLLERFSAANHGLAGLAGNQSDALNEVRQSLQQAVTELQFHDMATQLIVHTGQVLQGCAWKLAEEAIAPEEGEMPLDIDPMPERPSPVTQSEMDAGAIELF
jgi:ABC-type transporter Mla subunit MlaD